MQPKQLRLAFLAIFIVSIAIYTLKFDSAKNNYTAEINKDLIIGSWVEPIPGNETNVQGFCLNKDGSANSINMHTLVYLKWEINKDQLILTVKSIGNHTSSIDQEEYIIEQISQDRLKLNNGFTSFIYKRQ